MLHWFRRFDDYRINEIVHWQPLPEYHREDFTIGILGAGVLGGKVAQVCKHGAFRCVAGVEPVNRGFDVQSFAGRGRTVCISEPMSGID
ncbi:Rossmann-fold NAD(P)-binding domain-containing protein [Klebsiella pneumoniae]|uniref:hypothetical protein n=1 Tax=Klebsiella pneumoniae TaxID=573 RepID=UPI001F188C9D